MSASDLGPVYTDATLFDTLCQTLESDLAKEACKTLKKAVADPICATVNQSIRESLRTEDTPAGTTHYSAETTPARFGTTFENTISHAVCAALKQAMDDTACSTLKSTIHHSFELALGRERIEDVRFVPSMTHQLIDSFCTSLEQITGNAVCAALKQAMDDTVCAALKKGVQRSFAQLTGHNRREGDIAEIPELWLDREFTWRAAADDDGATDAFSRVEDAVVKEICNRLKAAVTSTLCRLLQQTIKDTVEKHSTECKAKCQRDVEQPRAYERPRIHVRSIALVFMVGLVVVALFAVTLATPGPAPTTVSPSPTPPSNDIILRNPNAPSPPSNATPTATPLPQLQ